MDRMTTKYLANEITAMRIISAFFILFIKPLSVTFYVLYSISGITDMIDGTIARKTHTESKAGAVLDSIADIVFLITVLIKLLPVLLNMLPHWVIWAITVIAIIRILAYVIGALKFHKFVALHIISNKITGVVLFCVPYFMLKVDSNIVSIVLCIVAGVSSLEELLIDIKSKHFNPDFRSILEVFR